jgi:hypothetical protein
MMVRKEVTRSTDAGTASERPARPEVRAEKAERKRFEDARRQCRIVSDVRTKIDKSK